MWAISSGLKGRHSVRAKLFRLGARVYALGCEVIFSLIVRCEV